jgi:5'-nucleotidase
MTTGDTPKPPLGAAWRPLVLLSNDDGVGAPGLAALREALARYADVIVCAPEGNQSATSHSLSLHRILRLRHVGHDGGGPHTPRTGIFALDGTPADCVYVALHSGTRILPRRPDLVVSGMNHGLNLGVDVFYSGTVAAAREAALRGIPSVAVSADLGADRDAAARLGAALSLATLEVFTSGETPNRPPPALAAPSAGSPAPLLNVNIPPGDAWEVRATCLGARLYEEDVDYRLDPRGREYLWIGGAGSVRHDHVPGSDTEAFDAGVASVTPLSLDLWAQPSASFAAAVARASVRSV